MTGLIPVALLGWVAVAVVLFARLAKPHALVAVFVLGVLLLPEIQLHSAVPGRPPPLAVPGFKLTKLNALSYAALLALFLFGAKRLLSIRPHWCDLPMLMWCVCPLFSSLSNDLGLYDGFSETLQQTLTFGVPYLMGRIYLGDPAGLRVLALGIVLGGLLYVPLCVFEMRLSPQLHLLVYGFHQHSFAQTIRFGGYRPMVFMAHGLAVGLWMTAASVVAFWLYHTGAVRRLAGARGWPSLPMLWAVLILVPTTVLCRSLGALAIGVAGFVALLLSRLLKTRVAMATLLMVAPVYIGLRTSSAWKGEYLVSWVAAYISPDRAQSVQFRLRNEDLVINQARERPVFGWGGWGRSRVNTSIQGQTLSVLDGRWVLALGEHGWVGLAAFCLTLLLPAAWFTSMYPPHRWSEPALAPAAAVAVLLAMVMIDRLLNAMENPVFMLAAGGLAGLLTCGNVPEPAATQPTASSMAPSAQALPRWRAYGQGLLPWRQPPCHST